MSFGKDLADEFQMLTGNNSYQEVELITKLQDAFIRLSKGKYCYAVDIIHGNRSLVQFKYNGSWTTKVAAGTTCTRELSDMLFIVFSKKENQIRLMYMQNKKGDSSTKFKADLVQLCLLRNRCVITSPKLPACVFGDRRILKDAHFPSVGSYGVFYNNNTCIDMAYYSALHIKPVRKGAVVSNRKVGISRTWFGQTKRIGIYEETQGEETLESFADALIGMKIGTLITCGGPSFGELVSFLNAKSLLFRQSGFLTDDSYARNNNSLNFIGIPFACVIDADAFQE